ncbi:MAG: hypothetical protein LAT81_08835 [Oceanicaulis sp.]|nr:hypothetical protein [Oceanicaulis sp.]
MSDEELEQVEQLAALNYTTNEVGRFFGIHLTAWKNAYEAPGSRIKAAYERGDLKARATTEMAMYENAEKGNITAYQLWKKASDEKTVENIKQRLINGEL